MTTAREPQEPGVEGERSTAAVAAVPSVQSRVSSALAAGLMALLGGAALTWYYAHVYTSRVAAHPAASGAANAARARGDTPLPPLGPIVAPPTVAANAPAASAPAASAGTEPPPVDTPAAVQPALTVATPPLMAASVEGARPVAPAAGPVPKGPRELERERRLAGGVYARRGASPGTAADPASPTASAGAANVVAGPRPAAVGGGETTAAATSLESLLRNSGLAGAQARMLPTAHFLLPKGAFIDCTLETAIDSTLPGMTTCVTAADTFGADGKVVLLERGSKLVGETRGQVQQGQARVFVVWTEARTPTGVVVPLDSPGTDALGRSGLPGDVQRHFWERFGAALLISVIDGAVQAGVQASSHAGGTVIYAPSASQDVMTEALKSTVDIPPTIAIPNGDRIEVLVARDVDFRPVYELRTTGQQR